MNMTKREMEKWTRKVPFNPVVLVKQHSNQKRQFTGENRQQTTENKTNELKNTAQKLCKLKSKEKNKTKQNTKPSVIYGLISSNLIYVELES